MLATVIARMDTESPVVWPSWCYTGDTGATLDSHDAGPSPHQQLLGSGGGSSKSSGTVRKRRTASERTSGIVHTSPVNSTTSNGPADYATHNNNNNNNHVKNERLSPGTPEPSSMVNSRRSRSRSVTPSPVASHPPDTPPTNEHGGLPGRNYSDMIRSLAAKYNNNNPNDYFNVARNGLPPASLDPRFRPGFNFPPVALLPSLSAIPTSSSSPSSSKEGIEAAVPLTASSVAAAAAAAALKNKTEMPSFLTPFAPMIDMSSTQTLLAMYKSAKEMELHQMLKGVKRQDSSSPLDLSAGAGPPPMKRVRTSKQPPASSSPLSKREHSESPKIHNHQEDISHWSVDDVSNFVSSIDICAEYAQTFRDQRIDGSGLPLLTEDHLTATMHMKLGPALKLRSILAKKLGSCNVCLHCTHCHNRGSPEPSGNGSTSDSGGGTS